jgi:hypothetical protein
MFHEIERRRDHHLHFGGQIDPVLHPGEIDFEGFFIITATMWCPRLHNLGVNFIMECVIVDWPISLCQAAG